MTVGECFPKHAKHDYMDDPHHPGRVICRNCADVILIAEVSVDRLEIRDRRQSR